MPRDWQNALLSGNAIKHKSLYSYVLKICIDFFKFIYNYFSLCFQSYCCQTELDGQQVGACTAHAQLCGFGACLFLRVRECKLLLMAGKSKGENSFRFHFKNLVGDYQRVF